MQAITIGLDLAKHWFQVHGVDAAGKVVVKRRLRRAEVIGFFEELGAVPRRHGGLRDGAPLGARVDRRLATRSS